MVRSNQRSLESSPGIGNPASMVQRCGRIFRSLSLSFASLVLSCLTIAKQASKIPFDTDGSASSIEHLFTVFYQDRGYAAIKVQAVRAGEIVVDPASITVPFAVKIQEGRVYKLGVIHLPDNVPVTQAEITKTLAATPNGPVEGVRIRTLLGLIAGRYHSKAISTAS
jgi:hypothetical protein